MKDAYGRWGVRIVLPLPLRPHYFTVKPAPARNRSILFDGVSGPIITERLSDTGDVLLGRFMTMAIFTHAAAITKNGFAPQCTRDDMIVFDFANE